MTRFDNPAAITSGEIRLADHRAGGLELALIDTHYTAVFILLLIIQLLRVSSPHSWSLRMCTACKGLLEVLFCRRDKKHGVVGLMNGGARARVYDRIISR